MSEEIKNPSLAPTPPQPEVAKPEVKVEPAKELKPIVTPLPRIFVYDGREFPDPDAKMSTDEVRQFMSTFFPELANAEVLAAVARPSKVTPGLTEQVTEFKRRTGTKGDDNSSPLAKKVQTVAKAATIWLGMDDNERTGVRVGMFPYHKIMAAKKEGYNERELVVALMEVAKNNGGMIA